MRDNVWEQPFSEQPSTPRLDANVQNLVGELLTRQSGAEIRIPRPIGFEDLLPKGGFVLIVGRPASQSVDECGIAVFFQFALAGVSRSAFGSDK